MNTQAQFKTTGINGNFDDFEKYRLKEIAFQLKKIHLQLKYSHLRGNSSDAD